MTLGRVTIALAALLFGGVLALSRARTPIVVQAPNTEIDRLSGSIDFFEGRLAADPENAVAGGHLVERYLLRFHLGASMADVQSAERVSRALLDISPDQAAAHARLSSVLLMQHQFSAALDAADRAAGDDSTSQAALTALFDAAIAAGQYARAESALRKLDPAAASSRIRVAQWLEAHGEIGGAYHHLEGVCQEQERADARAQSVAWCLTELAGLQHELEGADAAAALLRRALAVQPGYRGAIEGLADLAHARHDWTEAERLYGAIASDAHPDLYLRLAEVQAALGRAARAAKYEQAFLRAAAAPGAEALYAHALAHLYSRDPETRDRSVQVARRNVARRPSVESYDLLAWTLYRSGEFEPALEASEQARRWGAPTPTMDFYRALTLEELGREAEATALLRQVRKRPDLLEPHARRLLQRPRSD